MLERSFYFSPKRNSRNLIHPQNRHSFFLGQISVFPLFIQKTRRSETALEGG